MNANPLDLARRNIVETRQLLERLITSSESFDYVKAKLALKQLRKKVRELGKLEAKFAAQTVKPSNICTIDFQAEPKDAQEN